MLAEKSAMCAFLHLKISGEDAPIATYFEHSSIIVKHIARDHIAALLFEKTDFFNALIDESVGQQADTLNIFLKLSEIANDYKRYDKF